MPVIVSISRRNAVSRRGHNLLPAFAGIIFLFGFINSCLVYSVCYNNADCPEGKVCDIEQGKSHGTCQSTCFEDGDCSVGYLCDPAANLCRQADCHTDSDCKEDFKCESGRCKAVKPLKCPAGMVPIERRFCIDIYEASRPDATARERGSDSSAATSKPEVLPWMVADNAEASKACQAAGKSLCTEDQWFKACSGPSGTVYAYGNKYEPLTCNGIDTYCNCDKGSDCQNRDPCPFPFCYYECGGIYMLETTGSFPNCKNGYGVFDMNGNLWEHVLGGDETRIRGGAFNCGDSQKLHRCDYIPSTWEPAARGFRCCGPGWTDEDAGPDDAARDGGGL